MSNDTKSEIKWDERETIMLNKILVTYATRYGSTQEVAEIVANTLREDGLEVELQPMRQVRTLEDYSGVVLGAPLYIGRWHKDAHWFLSHHQNTLTQLPMAIFALGPIGTDEDEMRGSREQLDKELEKYPWLKPASVEMFVGKYDPAKLGFAHKLLAILPASPLHGLPASDLRDWDGIHEWADNLAGSFQKINA
jgi:menaquinone-dependent protoporphyrinogen oxidase